MTSSLVPTGRRVGQGHLTLESLLDSPGLTPSPLSDFINDQHGDIDAMPTVDSNVGQSVSQTNASDNQVEQNSSNQTQSLRIPEAQRRAFLQEICSELVCILRMQDVNGYFLSLPAFESTKQSTEGIGFIQLGKKVVRNEYETLYQFKTDVIGLFSMATRFYPPDSPSNAEAQRLLNLSSDWLASLPDEHVSILDNAADSPEKDQLRPPHALLTDLDIVHTLPRETALRILNPDNHGIANRNERVRSIGDEAGQLRSGCNLLTGGYREDRRNKLIPYAYLDYGPYYSFAPYYDSGASHCTPEANQLLLSTTWLPSRTAYLPKLGNSAVDLVHESSDGEISKAVGSELVCSALAIGDHQLAVSLAVADMELRATSKVIAELDEILPGPEVHDDCVYSMCLANALTRDTIRSPQIHLECESTVAPKSIADLISDSCDLDQQSDIVELNVPDVLENPGTPSVTTPETTDELTESANDLRALYCAQYHRLGYINQNTASGSTLRPSATETAIAHRLFGRLINLSKRARPRDLVHPYAVRKAMGIKPDSFPLPSDIPDVVT